jgi:hypothetical protein
VKVTTWVDFSKEIEVSVSAEDIRCALSEALARPFKDIDDHPNRHDFLGALNTIARFCNAVTDEQIATLNAAQRKSISEYFG